jgi:hypothetical protein
VVAYCAGRRGFAGTVRVDDVGRNLGNRGLTGKACSDSGVAGGLGTGVILGDDGVVGACGPAGGTEGLGLVGGTGLTGGLGLVGKAGIGKTGRPGADGICSFWYVDSKLGSRFSCIF